MSRSCRLSSAPVSGGPARPSHSFRCWPVVALLVAASLAALCAASRAQSSNGQSGVPIMNIPNLLAPQQGVPLPGMPQALGMPQRMGIPWYWDQPFPTTPEKSPHRPDEFDTAERGLQAGGHFESIRYSWVNLRCPGRNEAIVGMGIRRGDVVDFLRIFCATPQRSGTSYSWDPQSGHPGPSAGNTNGGDPHTAMFCAQNEMMAAFRARVVVFRTSANAFDYAQDIEIQCAQITSYSNGFYRVATQGDGVWHHPEGGFSNSHAHLAVRASITPVISCRPNGGVSAVSLGIADNFVNLGQRVVQSVSLYCPATPGPAPPCPPGASTVSAGGSSDTPEMIAPNRSGAAGLFVCKPPGSTWVLVPTVGPGARFDGSSSGKILVTGSGGFRTEIVDLFQTIADDPGYGSMDLDQLIKDVSSLAAKPVQGGEPFQSYAIRESATPESWPGAPQHQNGADIDWTRATPSGLPVFSGINFLPIGTVSNALFGVQSVVGTGLGDGGTTLFPSLAQVQQLVSRCNSHPPTQVPLYHEMLHVDHYIRGDADNTPLAGPFRTNEEWRTIVRENQYRSDIGVQPRTGHDAPNC